MPVAAADTSVDPLRVVDHGATRVLELNRPESLNALDASLILRLHDELDRLQIDNDVRVVVITGAGRAFCAGADLGGQRFPVGFRGSPQREWFEVQKRYSGVVLKLRRIPQPVIAAVNGPCAGGGFSIAMASDIRIVDPTAFFVAAQINIGQAVSEMGASYLLPRIVGGRAAEILLTGRRVSSEEAERIGLASEITAAGQTRVRALEIAAVLAAKAPLSLRLSKEAFDTSAASGSLEQAIAAEDRSQVLCVLTDDLAEGQLAFNERRPPHYSG
ncbi:MAG: enoyl-CoA hydratase/isomerase family protein [Ilumatobacteraceae bacterium]